MKKMLIIALIIINGLFIIIIDGSRRIGNNLLSVYLDNERVESIPDKGKGTYLNSVCDDENIKVEWDNDNWGLFVSGLSKKVKCNIYFSSDVEKPSWQVDSVSSRNVLTTDIYTVRLIGSDNSKISSNLNVNDIKFLVNGNEYEPIKKSLEVIESSDKKIIYELKIHMLKGEGKLVLRINNGTLKDDSGNESNSTDLDTGITIAKNNNTKILVCQDYSNETKNSIGSYYSNLVIDSTLSVGEIIKAKYDVVIYYNPYWGGSTSLNELYVSSINVISQYNNYDAGLMVNDDTLEHTEGGTKTLVYSTKENFLIRYVGRNFNEYDGGMIRYWHFNSKVNVLYQTTYNDIVYDKIGYLKESNVTWFNIGVSTFINYVPIIEFVMGRLEE